MAVVLTKYGVARFYNKVEKGDGMYYELYVDRLFLVNFMMNLYLLILVNEGMFRTATRKRLIGGATIGACCYFIPFLCPGPLWIRMIPGFLVSSSLMLMVTFPIKTFRGYWQTMRILFLYSLCLGGTILLFWRLFPGMRRKMMGFLSIPGLGILFFPLIRGCLRGKKRSGHWCYVTLVGKKSKMKVNALVDTGNSLREPISGFPVSIVDQSIVHGIWGEEPKWYRAIPYHSIGRKRGILKGYLLPEMRIEVNGVEKVCPNSYLAVCEEYLTEERDDTGARIKMIVHPDLLEK